jgi:hypothetical protein
MVKDLQVKLFFLILFVGRIVSSSPDLDTSANTGEPSGIITLTTGTFDSQINDGSSWMIEFYAPW